MALKGCFYVVASLCRLHAFNVFGVRAGFGMDASHIIPQSVLAIIPLIGVGGFKACAGCEARFSLCIVAVPPLSGMGSALQLLE